MPYSNTNTFFYQTTNSNGRVNTFRYVYKFQSKVNLFYKNIMYKVYFLYSDGERILYVQSTFKVKVALCMHF